VSKSDVGILGFLAASFSTIAKDNRCRPLSDFNLILNLICARELKQCAIVYIGVLACCTSYTQTGRQAVSSPYS